MIITLAVVAVCAVVLPLMLGSDDSRAESATPSQTPTPALPLRTQSVPAPSDGTVKDTVKAVKSPAVVQVPLTDSAKLSGSITVRVTRVTSKVVRGIGPGESTSPAVVATVEIDNGSSKSLNIDSAIVTLTFGKKADVGLPMTDGSRPFTGQLKPGASATGTYVFGVPKASQKSINLSVAYSAAVPVAQFKGGVK
ncbi:MAG: DUF4352 domain-containing protein [Aeromicrobium sp.]